MMQLSPDTRYDGWDGCSGYHYSDSIIYGFSHTHLSGTGVSDYGDLLIVPQSKKAITTPGYLEKNGYGSSFSHENETAKPGCYSVNMDNGINVKLASDVHSGIHEYTFINPNEKRFILIDLNHRDELLEAELEVISSRSIQGFRVSKSWANQQHLYFFIESNIEFSDSKLIDKNGSKKLLLTYPSTVNKIVLKVGISATDNKGAKTNLQKEIPHWSLNTVHTKATRIWNKELSKITFKSIDRDVMTNFYTGLYHSFLAPNIISDVDGRYRGRDMNIHQLENLNDKQYTVFSLWDTYRATHPLFTLTQVKRTNEFIRTFQRQYNEGGDLPVWELAACETECMIGYHSVSVIADAMSKGINNYDQKAIIDAMISTAKMKEFAKYKFHSKGYIDTEDEPESVSKMLEYAYDDYCIHQAIETYYSKNEFDKTTFDSKDFEIGMFNFINAYDPNSKFMRARRQAQWFSPFDPSEVNFNYTEANAWQYSLYTPHAVGVLTELLGGKDSLEIWLDRLFTTKSNLSGRHQVDITGLIGQYAHGNEPSHHMAYLYNYTNNPSKTNFYLDSILKTMYSNTPDGLSGNEDCGQMSSWYVLSALGFYQIAPSNPYYEIGRPLFSSASINFENGNELKLKALNNDFNNKYVEFIILNNDTLNQNYISHEQLTAGGQLTFVMTDKTPKYREHAPTINEISKDFTPLPFVKSGESIFIDSTLVQLGVNGNSAIEIYYGINEEPNQLYTKPFRLTKSSTLQTQARQGENTSTTLINRFIKKDTTIDIVLNSKYANQYAAQGKYTLIDGIKGNEEYRTGTWQGYWDQDLKVEIQFTTAKEINEISLNALSDMKSWIFLPTVIEIWTSADGIQYKKEGFINHTTEQEADMPPHSENFTYNLENTKSIKSFKIIVKNPGSCPEWHSGKGNPTWMFFDEIMWK